MINYCCAISKRPAGSDWNSPARHIPSKFRHAEGPGAITYHIRKEQEVGDALQIREKLGRQLVVRLSSTRLHDECNVVHVGEIVAWIRAGVPLGPYGALGPLPVQSVVVDSAMSDVFRDVIRDVVLVVDPDAVVSAQLVEWHAE